MPLPLPGRSARGGRHTGAVIRAVIFDLDGVLLDSEQVWDEVRREVVAEHGGRWRSEATATMQGMSSVEWSAYLRDRLGLDLERTRIVELVVDKVRRRYRDALPLVPGAVEAVRRLGARWPLGLASSSNRVVIDEVLEVAGITALFAVTVSSEEVPRGKPAPDVYEETARRLGVIAGACVTVEDSTNGIRSALAAGMRVVAVPNPHFPPEQPVLARADAVVNRLGDLDLALIDRLGASTAHGQLGEDARLDEEEVESFPASDAHSDWAGPVG